MSPEGGGANLYVTMALDGTFASGVLEPGVYRVSVLAPGYIMDGDLATLRFRPGDVVSVSMRRGGVITGTVSDARGEPAGEVRVRAVLAQVVNTQFGPDEVTTDERGVYRIYGLEPGDYFVSCDGALGLGEPALLRESHELETYHPSASRMAARKVTVRAAVETTGIDIRLRGARGYSVRGTVSGSQVQPAATVHIGILRPDGSLANTVQIQASGPIVAFTLQHIENGEHDVFAGVRNNDEFSVATTRVKVGGANVTGVVLTAMAASALGGRVEVLLNPANLPEACAGKMQRSMEEVAIRTQRVPGSKAGLSDYQGGAEQFLVPDVEGRVTPQRLIPGTYAIDIDLPRDDFYVSAVTRSKASGGTDVRRVELAPGQRVTDLVVSIGHGAACVSGRVVLDSGGVPEDVMVYAVPAEGWLKENSWRFAEAALQQDGRFSLSKLAPGKYWLLVRRAPKQGEDSPRWDKVGRAQLRRDAEAAKQPIELAHCQRMTDLLIHFAGFGALQMSQGDALQK
ncbi:MAG: carboxypeptidase-like regulatory domain-containing protein [Blastocatellia bacterium]